MTWDTIDDISKFWLQRKLGDSGTWTDVSKKISGSKTSITDSGVECGEDDGYTYRLAAYGDGEKYDAEWSDWSDEDSVSLPCPTPTNTPPNIDSGPSSTRYPENRTTAVGTYIATDDDDGDTITWTLPNTTFEKDRRDFTIVNGELKFINTPNYEEPDDSDDNNVYKVTVRASDGNGGKDEIDVTITVTDVNEAPKFTSTTTTFNIRENTTAVAGKRAEDEDSRDGVTYDLSGTDDDLFSISSSGTITFENAPNFEQPGCGTSNNSNRCTLTVTATGGAGRREKTATQDLTVNVTDVNEAPGKPSAPNVSSGGETSLDVTWSAPTNTGPPINDYDVQYRVGNSGSFTGVTHTGTERETTISDLESGTSYEVQVKAKNAEGTGGWSDSGTGSTDADVNALPVVSGDSSVDYGENGTAAVATYSATDEDGDSITWTLPDTAFEKDLGDFTIVNGELKFINSPNYEDPDDSDVNNVYKVTVRASDGNGGTDEIDVTVTVTDGNDPPVISGDSSATYSENGTAAVKTYSASDEDWDSITWTLPDTTFEKDLGDFTIDNGELKFINSPNYEDPDDSDKNNVYKVTVRASDGNGGSDEIDVTVTVTDGNDPPAFPSSPATRSVAENTAQGTDIGSPVTATDTDGDTLTYTIGGTDGSSFSIVESTGQLRTDAGLDFETKSSYLVTVTASDGNGGTGEKDVTIMVTDVNEAPVFADTVPRFDIRENQIAVAVKAATDPDSADTRVTYALSGTDVSLFRVSNDQTDAGHITFKNAPDYESPGCGMGMNLNICEITVEATGGTAGPPDRRLSASQDLIITVEDSNEPPFFTSSDSFAQDENDTEVGMVAVSDPDSADTSVTYALSGTDHDLFSIDAKGLLTFRTAPDFENPQGGEHDDSNAYEFTVTATGGTGKRKRMALQNLTVTVRDVNESPVVASGFANLTVANGLSVGVTVVGKFSDPDGDTLTYTASSSDSNIVDASVSSTSVALEAKHPGSATIMVTAADRASGDVNRLTVSDDFTVTVTPSEPEGPTTKDMIGGRGITFGWNLVDGADEYEAETSLGSWKLETISTTRAINITRLTPNETYSFKVRACKKIGTSCLYSPWSRTVNANAPAPTQLGHQEDHTVAYQVDTTIPTVIQDSIGLSVAAWTTALGMIVGKDLKICKVGVGDCDTINHDNKTVTVMTAAETGTDKNTSCGVSVACTFDSPPSRMGDHIKDVELVIEDPAWECRRSITPGICDSRQHFRIFWTNMGGDHGDPGPTAGSVLYHIDPFMIHEFGHTFGLPDFYLDDMTNLKGKPAVMDDVHANRSPTAEDIAQLRAIYAIHEPTEHDP